MEFRDFTRAFAKESIDGILSDLRFIAQGCYERAINSKTFQDDTGALRSSIGWAVCKDGSIVYQGGFSGGNSDGKRKGLEVVRSLAKSKGISLVLVAGMEYASYVEAKGFDVNTSGELLAEEMVKWWLNA